MDQKQRRTLRVAQLLRDNLLQLRCCDACAELPEQLWAKVLRLSRDIERARDRGWINAARRLTDDLRRDLHTLQGRLLAMSDRLDGRTSAQLPGEGDIFREIMALDEEFLQVETDPESREIHVTTEPIILDGVYLGPFEIRLDLQSIGVPSPYRVVATDANPASTNESVTHPHIQDETLCEGEGRAAIGSALASGRICDFFVLVHRVLNTYARGDAYVELSDWDGITCSDCGATTREDDSLPCRSCDDSLCLDCTVTCQACGHDFCSNCIGTCGLCDNHVCDSCLEQCTKCRSAACSDCLVDGLCSPCQEEEEEANDENETSTEAVAAELAVQSVGLGQAAVSP